MKAELFTCSGLTKRSCLLKSYCGWCVQNATHFCKTINACDFTNSTNSTSPLLCETGINKYRCVVEKEFMLLLVIFLCVVCVFILVDTIKIRMKKLLKTEFGEEDSQSTVENLPKYECIQEDSKELQEIANEKTSLLINSEKGDINETNDMKYERINKIVNSIGSITTLIMLVVVILPTIILYYSNILLFLVDIFFFIIFVLLICVIFR